MNKFGTFFGAAALACLTVPGWGSEADGLRIVQKQILENRTMDEVNRMAHQIVSSGLNAGDGYGEVWIRDFNTFIQVAMDVSPDSVITQALNTFFYFQGKTGDIVDGYIDIKHADLDKEDTNTVCQRLVRNMPLIRIRWRPTTRLRSFRQYISM